MMLNIDGNEAGFKEAAGQKIPRHFIPADQLHLSGK